MSWKSIWGVVPSLKLGQVDNPDWHCCNWSGQHDNLVVFYWKHAPLVFLEVCDATMPENSILQIKNFSQNMLLCTMTHEEIHRLFAITQTIRMETLEWIAEATRWCAMIGRAHSWHWVVDKRVDSDQFPVLEGQLLLSDTGLEPSDFNALILTFQPNRLTMSLCHHQIILLQKPDAGFHQQCNRDWGCYVVNIPIYYPFFLLI